jgi:hypothetical protein
MARHEHSWTIEFTNGCVLGVSTVWRVFAADRIAVTSEDHGSHFGLSSPLDAGARAAPSLHGALASIAFKRPSLDLQLGFDGGGVLEILNTSTGYEAWHLVGPRSGAADLEIILAGGDLYQIEV